MSPEYIERELSKVDDAYKATRRLQLDLTDILTGPTSGGNAARLAIDSTRDPYALALAMKAAAERYLESVK